MPINRRAQRPQHVYVSLSPRSYISCQCQYFKLLDSFKLAMSSQIRSEPQSRPSASFREKALHFRPPWCEGPRDPAPKVQLAKPSQLIPRLLPQMFEDLSVANELNYLAIATQSYDSHIDELPRWSMLRKAVPFAFHATSKMSAPPWL